MPKVNGGIANLDITKKQVAAAHINSTGNLTLSGTQTVNFYACVAGNTVLATAQTTGTENGLWIVNAGAWTRHPEWPTGSTYPPGLTVTIQNTTYGTWSWQMTTTTAVVVGTDASTWNSFSMGANTVRGNATGAAAQSNDITINPAQHLARGTTGNIVSVTPSRVVAQTPSDVTVTNTVANTAIATWAIPAGLVVPGDVLTFLAMGDILNNSGSPATFTLFWQISTASTAAVSYAASANKYRWRLQADLLVGATVSAQVVAVKLDVGAAVVGTGTMAAIDTAKSHVHQVATTLNMANLNNFVMSVTHGTAASTITTVCHGSYVTLTRNL